MRPGGGDVIFSSFEWPFCTRMPRRSASFDAVLHIPAMRQALLEVCIGSVDELSERTALLGGLRTRECL